MPEQISRNTRLIFEDNEKKKMMSHLSMTLVADRDYRGTISVVESRKIRAETRIIYYHRIQKNIIRGSNNLPCVKYNIKLKLKEASRTHLPYRRATRTRIRVTCLRSNKNTRPPLAGRIKPLN